MPKQKEESAWDEDVLKNCVSLISHNQVNREFDFREKIEECLRDNNFKSLPNWGASLCDIPYAVDYNCPSCNWSGNRKDFFNARADIIVGLSHNCPLAGRSAHVPLEETRIGAIILECPDCFSKFWFHAKVMTVILMAGRNNDVYQVLMKHYSEK